MLPAKTKFLVVDDSQLMRNILVQALKKLGFTNVLEASGGKEALSLLHSAVFMEQPVEIVLADIWMLDMNGPELLKECHADDDLKKTRFLFVTAERDRSFLSDLVTEGAAGYIFKPVDEHALKSKLNEMFAQPGTSAARVSFEILPTETEGSLDDIISFDTTLSEEDLRNVLKIIPGFVLRARADGMIEEVNYYLRAHYNVSADHIIKPNLLKSIFSSSPDKLSLEVRAEISGRPHHFNVAVQKYNEGKAAILIGTSITSQKNNEEKLQSLSTLITSLEEMAAAIAYQANIPLLVLQSRATRLQKLAKSKQIDPTALLDSAVKIEDAAFKIKKIVKSLRTFAKGEHSEPLQKIQLKRILDDVLEHWKVKLTEQHVDLLVGDIPDDIQLECRETEIALAILNLLNNAADAVQTTPEKWVKLDVIKRDSTVDVAVLDSGTGIPIQIRERLSRPFYASKDSSEGLGLSISKGIVEDHNGKLWIDTASENTRVVLTLPRLSS